MVRRLDGQADRQSDRQEKSLTEEREGFSSVGDSVGEDQTVSSLENVSDQTTD